MTQDSDSKDTLVNSIRKRIFGPSYFAEKYWNYIKQGNNPDDF